MHRSMISPAQWLPALLMLSLSLAHATDGESETLERSGSVLAHQSCIACHGPGGNSQASPIPSIAGLPRDYLLQVLRSYRYGGRFSTLMGRLLQGYSEEQLASLAEYFSGQAFRRHKQRVDWDLVFTGKQLHRIYCRECHGDLERSPSEGSPPLNGRWMDYLRWTLQDYLLGVNQAEPEMSEALARLVKRHGESGVEALVHYYGSAKPRRLVLD